MATDISPLLTRRAALAQLMALGAVGGSLPVPAFASTLQLGAPAPPAALITLEGKRISTTDLLGQVVVLTFWATWCVPCREELPLLSAYAQQHAAQGLAVLAFSLDAAEDMRRVREVAQTFSFPSGLLANSSAPEYGRMWRIPVNFTIDRKGLLVDNGWLEKKPTWTAERLDRIVTPLLVATN
jgi:cytochrome c biogenesis protein CcmG/thiol:disulfide interchange protein DsbE